MSPFELFLSELAKALNFSSLAPDSQGVCLIQIKNEETPLLFEFDDQLVPNTVLLSSPVSAVPIERRAEVFESILMANLEIEDTLSVKPDEDMLFLHRRLHPQIHAREIREIIKTFLDTVRTWKEKIDDIRKLAPRPLNVLPFPPAINVFPNKP